MKRQDSILANFYRQELSKVPSYEKGGDKKKKKKVQKQTIDYVDLEKKYNLDPFSKEGIEKARQLSLINPQTRIVCTAKGCSEIAVNAAEAYGHDFNRGHAWDLGNTNTVVATNPVYKNLVGKGILPDPNPKDYSAPVTMFRPGSIIGLNRKNNLVGTKATSTSEADDSFDYANQTLYPKSRGYEHVGYMLDDKTMLHGTGAGHGLPAFYTIDSNLSDGIQLGNFATYQPVETIQESGLQEKQEDVKSLKPRSKVYSTNPISRLIRLFGFKNGGQPPVNPNGMYDGVRDWRIPGGDITMENVPFPVAAYPSNSDQPTIMKPGKKYNFPGANYVDEYPINLRLPKYEKPKGFFTGYGFSVNPVPRVNVYGVGVQGEKNISDRLGLTGGANTASVFYPGGSQMFVNPSVNIGVKYRFNNGGDISIPNLKQPVSLYKNGGTKIRIKAYGGPMVKYMAGKMTGPNIF